MEIPTKVRYGVAIDRVTGGVAHGQLDMEVVTDGEFSGRCMKFTGQLGLVGAALCDMADGFVRLGYGKAGV